jgi:hypothetical protein
MFNAYMANHKFRSIEHSHAATPVQVSVFRLLAGEHWTKVLNGGRVLARASPSTAPTPRIGKSPVARVSPPWFSGLFPMAEASSSRQPIIAAELAQDCKFGALAGAWSEKKWRGKRALCNGWLDCAAASFEIVGYRGRRNGHRSSRPGRECRRAAKAGKCSLSVCRARPFDEG